MRRSLLLALGASLATTAALPFACGRSSETRGGSPSTSQADASTDRAAADAGHDSDAVADAATDVLEAPPVLDAELFSDPTYWTPVPGLEKCGVRVGKPGNPLFAPKVWADCGTGCLVTSAELPRGTKQWVLDGNVGAAMLDGSAFVRLVIDASEAQVEQIVRVSDGTTANAVAMLPAASQCYIAGSANDVIRLFTPFWNVSGVTDKVQGGVVDASEWGPIQWLPGWLTLSGAHAFFQWHGGWGIAFDDGTVQVAQSQTATSLMKIDSNASAPIVDTAGRAAHVFWAAWNGIDRDLLRGFVDGAPAETYVDPSTGTRIGPLALSDAHLVWLVRRNEQADGAYLTLEVDYSPVPDHAADVVVTVGPQLPATSGLGNLGTGGDYAAAISCYKSDATMYECRPFVVQLSTKKVWRVRPRVPGYYMNAILGVSNDEIVVGETDSTKAGVGNHIRRIVRFKTASLGTWADAL